MNDLTDEEISKAFCVADVLLMRKGRALPVGTVRNWKGKEYIKTEQGKWVPKKKSSIRIKQNLIKTSKIADYLETKLNKMGFKTDRDYSGLSDSEYITITNYKDITNKESFYNGEEYKIRISGHNLPPSYEGKHGYYDEDIMSENNFRGGNNGNATYYDNFLKKISSLVPEKHDNKKIIKLPNWASSSKSIKNVHDKVVALHQKNLNNKDFSLTNVLMFLNNILRGDSYSNYKPYSKAQISRALSQNPDINNKIENLIIDNSTNVKKSLSG